MPTFHGVFPETRRQYGLSEGSDAWKVELNGDDVVDLAGPQWNDVRLLVVAEEPPRTGEPTAAGGPRTELFLGSIDADIVYVEARLEGHQGALQWSWDVVHGERLDLLHIERMKPADVTRLLRARKVIVPKLIHIGRPPGPGIYDTEEFVAALAAVVRDLRRNRADFTQPAVVRKLRLSATTFRTYLREARIDWSTVKRGEWPEG